MSKIALVKEMIDSAESSLRGAKQLLAEVTGSAHPSSVRAGYARAASGLSSEATATSKIIEGVFDGQNMIGPDNNMHPVPANYASKSKLIPGDVLKLTIPEDGSFVYKQIGPVERKRVTGPLTQENGQYKVIANGRAYKVLLASVTYFRAEPGDHVVLIVPEHGESEWGAIENAIPKLQVEMQAEEDIIKEASGTAHIISENLGSGLDAPADPLSGKEESEEKPKKRGRKKKEED